MTAAVVSPLTHLVLDSCSGTRVWQATLSLSAAWHFAGSPKERGRKSVANVLASSAPGCALSPLGWRSMAQMSHSGCIDVQSANDRRNLTP